MVGVVPWAEQGGSQMELHHHDVKQDQSYSREHVNLANYY